MAVQNTTDETKVAFVPRHRNILLGLITCITVGNVLHLGAGIGLTVTIDYTFADEWSRPTWWYSDWGAGVARLRLAFFYCTIPAVLSIVSFHSAFLIRKSRLSRLWFRLSACFGFALWAVQMSLEGSCIWVTAAMLGTDTFASHCPFAYRRWMPVLGPYGIQSGGLVAAWIVPWFVAPLLILYVVYAAVGWRMTKARTKQGMISVKNMCTCDDTCACRAVSEWYSPEAPKKAEEEGVHLSPMPEQAEKVPVVSEQVLSVYTISSAQVPPDSTVVSTKGVNTSAPPSYSSGSLNAAGTADSKGWYEGNRVT